MARKARNPKDEIMTEQLYIFADTYFNSRGAEHTYKHAAIVAGAAEGSAHTLGSKWASKECVKAYWKSLEQTYSATRRAIHMRALNKLEDVAFDKIDDPDQYAVGVTIFQNLVKDTAPAFNSVDNSLSQTIKNVENKSFDNDPSTNQTWNDFMNSVKLLVNKKDEGGELDG